MGGITAAPHIAKVRERLNDIDSFVRAAAAVALGQIQGADESSGSRTRKSKSPGRRKPGSGNRPSSAPRQHSSAKLWAERQGLMKLPVTRPPAPTLARGGSLRKSRPRSASPRRRRAGRNYYVSCNCGFTASTKRAMNGGRNEGLFYLSCPRGDCDFFLWIKD